MGYDVYIGQMRNNTMSLPEVLEAWDWEIGLPTGEPITRDAAHRNGIPHEAVHLWIVRHGANEPELLFQLRAPHKENYPGVLDITVGGHVPYGYCGNKVLKETKEEIGIIPNEQDLVDLGWYRYEERTGHLFQREFQHVYLLRSDLDLNQFCFDDGEVTGIYAVRVGDLKRIMAGEACFEVTGFNGRELITRSVTRKDFHPQLLDPSMNAYMQVILVSADELAATGRVTTRMPDI
jgi:isopentenyldiphosphate isomerase